MPRIPNRLVGPLQLAGADALLFTAPASGGTPNGGGAIVRHIHVENPTGGPVNLFLSIGADTAANRIYDTYPIAATSGLLDVFCYYVLGPGETLRGHASAATSLGCTIDGDLIYVG